MPHRPLLVCCLDAVDRGFAPHVHVWLHRAGLLLRRGHLLFGGRWRGNRPRMLDVRLGNLLGLIHRLSVRHGCRAVGLPGADRDVRDGQVLFGGRDDDSGPHLHGLPERHVPERGLDALNVRNGRQDV